MPNVAAVVRLAKAAFASAAPAPVSPFAEEEEEEDDDTPVNLSEVERDSGSWSFVWCHMMQHTHIFVGTGRHSRERTT